MQPRLNLLVLRSADPERLVRFYTVLGLEFTRHRHGSGPEHHASESPAGVFEIYPSTSEQSPTRGLRLGFEIEALDAIMPVLLEQGATLVSSPKVSPWGLRAVLQDPDGYKLELIERARS